MHEEDPKELLGDIDDDDAFDEGDEEHLANVDWDKLPQLEEDMKAVKTKDDAKILYGRLANG